MTFGTTYHYRCAQCPYHFEMTERDPVLFMAEGHILGSDHWFGIFKKTELDDQWNQKVVYAKESEYIDVKKRFKLKQGGARK